MSERVSNLHIFITQSIIIEERREVCKNFMYLLLHFDDDLLLFQTV